MAKACIQNMVNRAGGRLTAASAEALLGEYGRMMIHRMQTRGVSFDVAKAQIVAEVTAREARAKSATRRQKMLSIRALENMRLFFNSTPDVGKAMGSYFKMAEAQGKFLAGLYLAKLEAKLKAVPGAIEEMRSAKLMQDDVLRELWDLSLPNPRPGGVSGKPVAYEIAKAFHEINLESVKAKNLWGADIRTAPGWVVPQSTDQMLLRKAGGETFFGKDDVDKSYKAWRQSFIDHGINVDVDRTIFGSNPEEFFREFHAATYYSVYEVGDGAHGGGSLAKKMSEERKLWFTDAESARKYNELWGSTPLYESMLLHLDRSGKNISLMENFGPHPDANFEKATSRMLGDTRANRLSAKNVGVIQNPKWQSQLDILSGRANHSVNPHLSRLVDSLKNFTMLTKGLGITLSTFSDRAFIQNELVVNGMKAMDAVAHSMEVRLSYSPEREATLHGMGLFAHAFNADAMSRWVGQDRAAGFLSGWTRTMMNLTGLNRITDMHRNAAGFGFAAHMGSESQKQFGALNRFFQEELGKSRIGPSEWDLIRTKVATVDGTYKVITADQMYGLDDADVAAYLQANNRPVTRGNLDRTKQELAMKVGGFLQFKTRNAVPEPNVGVKYIGTGMGSPRGTFVREMAELLFMFKGFPVAAAARINTVVGSHLAAGEYMNAGFYLTSLMAQAMVAGYLTITIKDLLKGRTPRRLYEDGKVNTDVFIAALQRGGGGGIYNDFLFSEYDRRYRNFSGALAGPVLGQMDPIMAFFSRARNVATGNEENPERLGYEAFRLLEDNTPFINHFLLRPVLDHMIMWHIKEALSPGVLRRVQRSTEEHNHQEYFLEPLTY